MADLTPVSPKGRFDPMTVAYGDEDRGGWPTCVICSEKMGEGDIPTLVGAVPADDEEQAKADAGLAYNARCDIAHESCAYPEGGA